MPDMVEQIAAARAVHDLSPTQTLTRDTALALLQPGAVVSITQGLENYDSGRGATTIMRSMQHVTGGSFVDVGTVFEMTRLRHPRQFEQSTFETIRRAAEQTDTLYLDHPPYGLRHAYNRYGMIGTVLRYVAELARTRRKRIVFAGRGAAGAVTANLPLFGPQDYAHLFAAHLGAEAAGRIDMTQVHDHASYLSGHRIARIAAELRARGLVQPTTRDVIGISASLSGANINLSEVEPLTIGSLKGFEPIFRRLDRSIVMPMREPDLARRMGLEAKRGVLLHGPPGTGKTSIGRALAHQMQGRFFMIDGDYNHQLQGGFYDATAMVFDMAARAAPAVLFIDDADVILGDPAMQHWGRFLLTKLDGLHSRAAGRVCVMMTAMNIHDLPLALLRSGRIDLWLETRLPDAATRREILTAHVARLGFDDALDPVLAGEGSEGFTPADLRSVVDDMAGFVGLDRVHGRPRRSLADYFLRATAAKREHKAIAARVGQGVGA